MNKVERAKMQSILEHKQLHAKLHTSLDTLVGDWCLHNTTKSLSESSIMDLIDWSYAQSNKPTNSWEYSMPIEPANTLGMESAQKLAHMVNKDKSGKGSGCLRLTININ